MQHIIEVKLKNETIQFLSIPHGTFYMGSTMEEIENVVKEYSAVGIPKEWLMKEYPQHEVYLDDYYMAMFPITNKVWEYFIQDTKYDEYKKVEGFDPVKSDYPVWGINIEDLSKFILWFRQETNMDVSVPTEEEWEKAARTSDRREYPWGNNFDSNRCNTIEGNYGGLTPVSKFPAGISPYGIFDMCGNIEEWTSTLYEPYKGGEEITDDFGGSGEYYITRGGSFTYSGDLGRCARRHGLSEKSYIGGRLVLHIQ